MSGGLIKDSKQSFKNSQLIDFESGKITAPNSFGIYFIEIYPQKDFDFQVFEDNWKSNIIKTPNIIKNRITDKSNEKWYPFYIGKSEKLYSRINEHCFHQANKTTYGLKLGCRTELLKQAQFRFSFYEVANRSPENVKLKSALQFIITNLEKELRDELKPWIGKQ